MQEKSSQKFADRLKAAMADSCINSARLAKDTGISKGYISELRGGSKGIPSFEILEKFASVLKCSPKWLRTGQIAESEREVKDLRHDDPEKYSSVLREDSPPYRFTPKGPQCQGHDATDPAMLTVLTRIADALEKLVEVMNTRNAQK